MPLTTHADVPRIRAYYRTVARFIDRELDDRGDAAFWRRRAAEAGGPVLELGCGTGRVTEALAEGGVPVTGVDLSPDMLARARRRLVDHPGVHLLRADMRALPLRGAWALVAAADDPFTHLLADADRDRALAEAARVMAPGGRLVIDVFRMDPGRLREAASPGGWHRQRTLDDGRGTVVRETWWCDVETHRCRARYEYLCEGRRLDEARFTCRMWRDGELEDRLGRAGLEPLRRWGGWDERPAGEHEPVHVVAARARA